MLLVLGVWQLLQSGPDSPVFKPEASADAVTPALAASSDPFAAVLNNSSGKGSASAAVSLPERKGVDPFKEFLEKQNVSPFGVTSSETTR